MHQPETLPSQVVRAAVALAERGLAPDALIRAGIRRLSKQRLAAQSERWSDHDAALGAWLEQMDKAPIAPASAAANEQHYEVPAAFYELVLGRARKYSCAYFPAGVTSLDDAERAMLALTAERAELADGQRVLDLGCGWGAFTLWAASRLPNARFTAVSGARAQGRYIERRVSELGLKNVEVLTEDMNVFAPRGAFDRVVSVEMFEHMRNWRLLLSRVHSWLAPGGKAFIHVFSHRSFAYPFETQEEDDWMAKNFFSGGMMPSHGLLAEVAGELEVESASWLSGTHYQRTAEAWLANLDRSYEPAVRAVGGGISGPRTLQRWRIFFMACAEVFGFEGGSEWGVSHYRLARTTR